jgi:hypothetical protein
MTEEIWVDVTEAAEKTGYRRDYLIKVVREQWNKPEGERQIQLRKLSAGYILWLPSLIEFINEHRHGPYKKQSKTALDKPPLT